MEKYNILYVDDEEINLRVFKQIFKREYNVFTAISGKAGLEILKNEEIQIIITDQRMPEMTGVEFLEHTLPLYPHIIRIMLTGYSNEEDIKKAINRCGIYHYLTKPWDEAEMRIVLKEAIHEYKFRSEKTQVIEELKQTNLELHSKIIDKAYIIEEQESQLKNQSEIIDSVIKELDNSITTVELAFQLGEKNKELAEKNKELGDLNHRLIDSIRYAKRIQQGILPHTKEFKAYFRESFVLFMPKDIVSGDFYWINNSFSEGIWVAVADCTGHGVPGAMMTMIGCMLLNQIVSSHTTIKPSRILELLDVSLKAVLRPSSEQGTIDGMDIAICFIEPIDNRFLITFSGAKRPLYYVHHRRLHQVRGSKRSIGTSQKTISFTEEQLLLSKGDTVYLFSDGICDLFSPEGKKLGINAFTAWLQECMFMEAEKQKQYLEAQIKTYAQEERRRDDITIVGICL